MATFLEGRSAIVAHWHLTNSAGNLKNVYDG